VLFRIARLKRLIAEARHEQACCLALAVETMCSLAYAQGVTGDEVPSYLSRAGNARDVVDGYLLELAAHLKKRGALT